jgi:hypothetical protein
MTKYQQMKQKLIKKGRDDLLMEMATNLAKRGIDTLELPLERMHPPKPIIEICETDYGSVQIVRRFAFDYLEKQL